MELCLWASPWMGCTLAAGYGDSASGPVFLGGRKNSSCRLGLLSSCDKDVANVCKALSVCYSVSVISLSL